jgi:hypothetical protein
MKKRLGFALALLVLLFGGASEGRAQARRVRMKIDGYLCGN